MDPAEIPLRDLHLPAEIGWWPLAPGWWLLLAVAIAGLIVLLRVLWVAHRKGAARRFALRRLEDCIGRYREHGNAVRLSSEVSALLRRAMLAYAPRSEIAGLTGEAWLGWLERDLGEPLFTEGAGRQLIELPYLRPDVAPNVSDVEALIDSVRLRLETPLGDAARGLA